MEKKVEQEEKRTELKDEMITEMVRGGEVIRQEDGSYYCTLCKKTVNRGHLCAQRDRARTETVIP